MNISGFISRDTFLYETRVLDSTYLRFKVQLPASDSTDITAGGFKNYIRGSSTPRRPLAENNYTLSKYLTVSSCIFIPPF